MVAREFPDLQWLKRQAEQGFADRQGMKGRILQESGWPSVVMNAKSRNVYRDNIPGPFSIFTNISGTSNVIADGRHGTVRDDFFFVTNQGQRYTLSIDEKRDVETCNVHFGEHFASQVLQSLKEPAIFNLDNPTYSRADSFQLHNRLYRRTAKMNCLLADLRQTETNLLENELLFALMVEIFECDSATKKLLHSIPAMKNSTRDEILRRLTNSVDYIYAYYDTDISLDDLSKAACLSKFHFLRLFKSAFRKTPHQFICEVRMHQAKQLLQINLMEIKQISRWVGFRDASSFSRMFYKFHGAYPTEFRARGN